MIVFPFLAAITDALSLIFSKFFFRRFGQLSFKEFNWLVFLSILTVLVLIGIGFHQFPPARLVVTHWPALVALGLLGALGNILFYHGLEEERVSNIEPLVVFNPLSAILIASIFYPSERSWMIYGAVAIAASVLAWANLRRHHFLLSRGLILIMCFWLTYGIETVLVKELLNFFSPVSLYMLRCAIVFISLSIFSRPNFKLIRAGHMPMAMLLGGLAVASVVSLYTAIHHLGTSASLFVMVLSPTLVYWFSGAVLHDRWNRKNIIAGFLIVLLVVGVSFWLNR